VFAATKTPEPSLYRLLRALTLLGLLNQLTRDTLGWAEHGELLCADVAGSVRELVLLLSGLDTWAALDELEHSVPIGEVGSKHVFGKGRLAHLAAHPRRQNIFNAAIADVAHTFVPALLSAADFTACRTVVEVGVGRGALLAGILAMHPGLTGVLLNTERGPTDALRLLDASGIPHRRRLVPGGFFDSISAGTHAYQLKSMLHDRDDDRCRAIVRACRAAMPDGATSWSSRRRFPPLSPMPQASANWSLTTSTCWCSMAVGSAPLRSSARCFMTLGRTYSR